MEPDPRELLLAVVRGHEIGRIAVAGVAMEADGKITTPHSIWLL